MEELLTGKDVQCFWINQTMASLTTSTFMTEILASAGHLEKDDLTAKLDELCKRIDGVKVELYHSLQQKYSHFQPSLATALDLSQRFNDTVQDMTTISNRIEKEIRSQLNVSTVEFQELSSELEESKVVLDVLESLVKIHTALNEVDSALLCKDYSTATCHLQTVNDILQAGDQARNNDIHMFQVIQDKYAVLHEQLVQDLNQTWLTHVRWHLPRPACKQAKKYVTELHVARSSEAQANLQAAVQAMWQLDVLQPKLQTFSNCLLNYVIEPILLDGSLKVDTPATQTHLTICLTHTKTKDPQPGNLPSVISSLDIIFKLLNKALLSMKVVSDGGDGNQQVLLMEMAGQLIGQQFVELLINKCLSAAIPSTAQELENFKSVVSHTETLERFFKKMHFLPPGQNQLVEYVSNVNVHFANKKCEEVLKKAHRLMCSSLHNTVRITSDVPFGELPLLGGKQSPPANKETKTAINMAVSNKACLSASTFRLPTCQISLCVQEVCTLVYESLHEATTSTPQCAVQLFFAVHNIFELFCDVVPSFHKEALSTLPQLSALHHNNCLYLAHHLMTLGHQFRPKLPSPLQEGMGTFVDLVPKIRRLGTECLLQQMTRQKYQMADYLRAAQGFLNVSEDQNFKAAEKSLKQCIAQLDHLSHVWKEVLPENIYRKAMGTLLNSMIVEVVQSIVSLDDIQSSDTHILGSLLATILEKAPEFFATEETVDADARACVLQHVAKWNRLQELQLVLDARLVDIADRWADGKGPLAAEFTANEVKQLIRALFQNSDRRATVLSKIK